MSPAENARGTETSATRRRSSSVSSSKTGTRASSSAVSADAIGGGHTTARGRLRPVEQPLPPLVPERADAEPREQGEQRERQGDREDDHRDARRDLEHP